ncbi:MAG: M48 family metalloprotease [Rhizorhabdus sp.]
MLRRLTAASAALALLLASCSEQPAPDYEPGVSAEARAEGAQQHVRLLAEFGGEYRGAQQVYLQRIGAQIAAAAGLEGQCTFTLVNSDVVNAFAVPGCYIYVTRGLMAFVNSEAELASVLGHEVGHIMARHGERQQERSIWSLLGVIAVSLAGSDRLTQLASAAAELFTLRYSRTQEYESDELGIRYLRTAGYDPYAAADMLDALTRNEAYVTASGSRDAARSLPEWASSHPLTDKRIERARGLARQSGLADNALPEKREAFLAAVDGLLFGDDPEQGFVIGRRFAHPVMKIGFEAPEGFTLTNSPQAITLSGPDGIRGEFAGGPIPQGGLRAYVEALVPQIIGEMQGAAGSAEESMINGLPAIIVPIRVATREGELPIWLAAYDAGGGAAYHFVIAAPGGGAQSAATSRLFASFHRLGAQEIAALRPREVDVVTVAPGATADSIGRSIDPVKGAALVRALNGDDAIRPGARIKIVRAR